MILSPTLSTPYLDTYLFIPIVIYAGYFFKWAIPGLFLSNF